MCLLCYKSMSNEAMKPSRLENHLKKVHPEKSNKPIQYFAELKAKYEKRETVGSLLGKVTKKIDNGLLASYKVSLLIAKAGKPHTTGEELILPAVKEIVDTMMRPSNITEAIPLSNNTAFKHGRQLAMFKGMVFQYAELRFNRTTSNGCIAIAKIRRHYRCKS
ncbi:hypothetical protein WDU94_010798 [Cyamophila willieti]